MNAALEQVATLDRRATAARLHDLPKSLKDLNDGQGRAQSRLVDMDDVLTALEEANHILRDVYGLSLRQMASASPRRTHGTFQRT